MPTPPSPGKTPAPGRDGEQPRGSAALQALGRRLRQGREALGLEAQPLADRLRLGVEQLRALEEGDRQRLPEPVFIEAQARRVAGALGLDIGPQLRALRDSGELGPPLRSSPAAAAVSAHKPPGRETRGDRPPAVRKRQWPLSIVLGATAMLLLAGLWGGWRVRQGGEAAQRPATPIAAPAPQPAPNPPAESVLLESRDPTWLEVRRTDGTSLFRGLLQGSRRFPLGEGLEVRAGRPDQVTSRIGQAPARVLGTISDVRWTALPSRPAGAPRR